MEITESAQVSELYDDAKACAKLIGLSYRSDNEPGIRRRRTGRSFRFYDDAQKPIKKSQLKKYVSELVIPPAWEEVWICPDEHGHILATGVDDKERKQYIYHPKWRMMRDLIKFYRMTIFARKLPKLRKAIQAHMNRPKLDYQRVIATMLWVLDNTYIRIGNNIYFEQNESFGLTTLLKNHVVIAGPVVTFSFRGKSGKEQQIILEDAVVARTIQALQKLEGERLFQHQDNDKSLRPVTSEDINQYLQDRTGENISAKDFRTWGGTLLAFDHLLEHRNSDKKDEKVVVEAVDTAANVLGNTRAVARSAYIHPHILETYGSKNFDRYYNQVKPKRKVAGLDKRESELLHFLEILFEEEFEILNRKT